MTRIIKNDNEAIISLIEPSETKDKRYKGGLYEIKIKKNIQKLLDHLTLEIIFCDQTKIIKNDFYDYSETIDSFSFHFTHYFEPNEECVKLNIISFFDASLSFTNSIKINNQ